MTWLSLNASLAEKLDFTQSQRINRSFIAADLQILESDLIYRVPYRSGETELERVLKAAMAGIEGLSEEQVGQWRRCAWFLIQFVYHRNRAKALDADTLAKLESVQSLEVLEEIGLRIVAAKSWADMLRDL